jgi:hypothetical protein
MRGKCVGVGSYYDWRKDDRQQRLKRIVSFADPARGRRALQEAIFRRLTAELEEAELDEEDASSSLAREPPIEPPPPSSDKLRSGRRSPGNSDGLT